MNAPSASSLDKWKKLTDKPQTARLACEYLEALGRRTVEALGYSYDDLLETVQGGRKSIQEPVTLPWEMLMRPVDTWGWVDWLKWNRSYIITRLGLIREDLRVVSRYLVTRFQSRIKKPRA